MYSPAAPTQPSLCSTAASKCHCQKVLDEQALMKHKVSLCVRSQVWPRPTLPLEMLLLHSNTASRPRGKAEGRGLNKRTPTFLFPPRPCIWATALPSLIGGRTPHLPNQIRHVGNSPGSINMLKKLELFSAAIKVFLRKLSIFRCDKPWHRCGLNSFKWSVLSLALFSS